MNWIKRWVSDTAYCQTLHRLDLIVDFIEISGTSERREVELEKEMKNLEKLVYGGFERKEVLNRYQERIRLLRKNDQEKKDSE